MRLEEILPMVAVLETERLPATWRLLPILLEAFEMKPFKVERPVTFKVEPKTVAPAACKVPEALRAPATWRPAETELEAFEMKPFKVERPKARKVPEAETLPLESTLKRPNMLAVEVAM